MRKPEFKPETAICSAQRNQPPLKTEPPRAPITGGSALLSSALAHILEEVQREIGYRLAASEGTTCGVDEQETRQLIEKISRRLGFELTAFEKDELLAQLAKLDKPFGVLQPLADDPQVSDIIVTNFSKISVQQARRTLSTDLSFPSAVAYEAFIERILQKASAACSTKKPIADGMIGNFARVHVVHSSLCESGPYLTIRLNRFSTVDADDLVRSGMAPKALLDYLLGMIALGQTILIVGEVGTGKTTLARALAAGIPDDDSILVIEDTPEIVLKHPHVRYITTREANSDGAGRVSPAECIRAGMRMAMNRIIFGEMRDSEAAEAFIDVCASGHPGLSTIHARSAAEAVTRLELFLGRAQRGVSRTVLTEEIATAVQVIVRVDICRETRLRRIVEVKEIGPVADGVLRQREIFRYQPVHGLASWGVIGRVSASREALERLNQPVSLSALPAVLELGSETSFKEVVRARAQRAAA